MDGETIELDARLAFALSIGWSAPPATREHWREMEARVAEVRALAGSHGSVPATRLEIATGLAKLTGVRVPTRPEGIELLSTIVLDLQASGVLDDREVYVIGGLWDHGWPVDPTHRLVESVIAAADVGLFDPPGSIDPRELEPLRPLVTFDESGVMTTHISFEIESAFVQARRNREGQVAPAVPRTVNEQFLHDWETLLGGIVDGLTQELAQSGYLDIGPG